MKSGVKSVSNLRYQLHVLVINMYLICVGAFSYFKLWVSVCQGGYVINKIINDTKWNGCDNGGRDKIKCVSVGVCNYTFVICRRTCTEKMGNPK